jgi:hypothetical protein
VVQKAASEHNRQSLRLKATNFRSQERVSNASIPRTNRISRLSTEALDHKFDSIERALRKGESTTADATNFNKYPGDENSPFERVARSSSPVSVVRSLSKDHGDGDFRNSSQAPEPYQRFCSSDSEYSTSLYSNGPRNSGLATPRPSPDSSENSSVSYSLSPKSRTSSRAPSMPHSGPQVQSTSSLTEPAHRTLLPTEKESNSTRNSFETKRDIELDSQQTPMVCRAGKPESTNSSQQHSADLPAEMSLKRKSLDSRCVSSDSIDANSPQMKTLSISVEDSRHQSPGVASARDMVGTSTRTHSKTRSPTSIVLSPTDAETSPRKRSNLGVDRMKGNITRGASSGSYAVFSSNPILLSSKPVDKSQDAGNKIVERQSRKLSTITVTGGPQLNDETPATRHPGQISPINNVKQDNGSGGPSHELSSRDHTPRAMNQSCDTSQLYARTFPINQLANIPPQTHNTLPPRPSITPPPSSSSQVLQKYRPPAVVFTIDNRAESRMPTADVQSFIEQFTKNARVITPPTRPSDPHLVYPIGVIMWQSLPDFYKWYKETTGSTEIEPLRFELLNVEWQAERAFVVPEGNLNYFRTLKQYVWDLFWVASNFNNGPSLFRVSVSPFPSRGAPHSSQPSILNSVKSTSILQISGATSLENIMVVAEPQTLQAIASPRPADRPPPLSTSTGRTSNIEHILNIKEVKAGKGRAGRRSTTPASHHPARGISCIGPNTSSSNRVPRPSEYIHGPPGPPINVNRTPWDKTMLRDHAYALVRHMNRNPQSAQ